ncbi:hypothetical protein I7I53_01258 [Histoplasma capsulatum var. duboisii H88]|uniref:Uncharacterized protein n=1 Tax=Ajellomyces capsulatus (strain H88) TaxID=544711 RepID=A0A8A1LPJ4_AJEC8|nr:hypothetical protein I7I53_01258 [Histoplasma capsulatum var. duboisii H88]
MLLQINIWCVWRSEGLLFYVCFDSVMHCARCTDIRVYCKWMVLYIGLASNSHNSHGHTSCHAFS